MNQPPYLSSETWISYGNPYGRMNMVIFWRLLGWLRGGYLFQEWDSRQNAAFVIIYWRLRQIPQGGQTSSMIHSTKVGNRIFFKITISTVPFVGGSIRFQVAHLFHISRLNWSFVQNMFVVWHDLELLLLNPWCHFLICSNVADSAQPDCNVLGPNLLPMVGMVINLQVYYIYKDSLS